VPVNGERLREVKSRDRDKTETVNPQFGDETETIHFPNLFNLRRNRDATFLQRCMECRRGLAMRILSVRLSFRLSVCLSNACIVTKRKKDLSRFLYHTKEYLA